MLPNGVLQNESAWASCTVLVPPPRGMTYFFAHLLPHAVSMPSTLEKPQDATHLAVVPYNDLAVETSAAFATSYPGMIMMRMKPGGFKRKGQLVHALRERFKEVAPSKSLSRRTAPPHAMRHCL